MNRSTLPSFQSCLLLPSAQNIAAARHHARRRTPLSRAPAPGTAADASLTTLVVHDGGSLAGNESSSVSSTISDTAESRDGVNTRAGSPPAIGSGVSIAARA